MHVVKPFNLLLNHEEQVAAGVDKPMLNFGAGRHDDVHPVIAGHPYVKLHLGDEKAAAGAVKPVTGNPLAVDLDAAVRRAEAAERGLEAERAAHAKTRAKLEAVGGADDDEADAPSGLYTIRRKGRGLFAVFRGEEQLTDPMPKVEAEARRQSEQQADDLAKQGR
ncbi:hypothetical protein [Methylobacterium sp. 1973]|uniref:hypothetical protein n=1 Tax=Methylobacterium sp. 1973 TaxID=3156421 RepID=UPI0033949A2D